MSTPCWHRVCVREMRVGESGHMPKQLVFEGVPVLAVFGEVDLL